MQVPVQALLQQTPSTQNPLAQSRPHEQGCPVALVPIPASPLHAALSLPPSLAGRSLSVPLSRGGL